MIGRPGIELSPAKWYDWINFPFSADCVEQPLSKSARNSKSKFSSFDLEKVPFRHLLPAISISSSFTKNQSAISFLPERSLSSSLEKVSFKLLLAIFRAEIFGHIEDWQFCLSDQDTVKRGRLKSEKVEMVRSVEINEEKNLLK